MQLTVSRLASADREALRVLLQTDRVSNVYLLSESRYGLAPNWWGIGDGKTLRAVALAGSLVVPFIPNLEDAARLWEALAQERLTIRMMVGERNSVVALHEASARLARDVREPQPVMWLGKGELTTDADPVPLRPATPADLEQLSLAAAAMHREELGIDPLQIDSHGWRLRMSQLVDRGWSWVWTDRGRIVFKAELSAWTAEAVQVQGVYTHPDWRGRGVAHSAMSMLCRNLLRHTQACTLYVNNYNHTAIRLYTRLGFRPVGEFATVIY